MTPEALRKLFTTKSTDVATEAAAHVKAITANCDLYEMIVIEMEKSGAGLTGSHRSRAAALLWTVGKVATFEMLVTPMIVSDVLAVVRLVDNKRQTAFLTKKLGRMKRKARIAALTRKQAQLKSTDLQFTLKGRTATSSFYKRIKKWVKCIPADTLEFFLLNFPKDAWQELSDYAHLRPSDFQLPYFLPVVFGEAAPPASLYGIMSACENSPEHLEKMLLEHPDAAKVVSYLRLKFKDSLTPGVKRAIAASAPLSEVIWWYEELDCPGIDVIVKQRLERNEPIYDATGKDRANFGKLMERLLMFKRKGCSFLPLLKPYADKLLKDLVIPTSKKVAVFGDASGSMQVAIDSATIIGAILCSSLNASLSYFKDRLIAPPVVPRCVDDIMKVTAAVTASNSTSPSACLYPFLKGKIEIDLFIIVTDEIENATHTGKWADGGKTTGKDGMMFAEMFEQYLHTVNAGASVFFVSFMKDTTSVGQMVESMQKRGLMEKVTQFRFDPARPDLTKVSTLLGMLALETADRLPEDVAMDVAMEDGIGAAESKSEDMLRVPVKCKDGELIITPEQASAVSRAFHNTEVLSVAFVAEALKSLRLDTDSSSLCPSDWEVVSTAGSARVDI